MNDQAARDTEILLDRVIAATTDRLRESFADLIHTAAAETETLEKIGKMLGLSIENAPVDERVVDRVTWHPVAELCVVSILRHVLTGHRESAAEPTSTTFAASNRALATSEFASRVGLSLDDARLALAVTSQVLEEAFEKPKRLEMDGSEFDVQSSQGALIVRGQEDRVELTDRFDRSARSSGARIVNRAES